MKPGIAAPDLVDVLQYCFDFWKASDRPPEDRELCHHWLAGDYANKFGYQLHPSQLKALAKMGYLEEGDIARAGGRRYYKLPNASRVEDALKAGRLD
jgi:hypothetical protein